MTYWYEVGVHRSPTTKDLPIVVEYPAGPVMHARSLPCIDKPGVRWAPVTLPSETAPPPEDEGVEVEGRRFRRDGRGFVQRRKDDGTWEYATTEGSSDGVYVSAAKVAIALGLVDPPVPADVQRVVDAAKAWRKVAILSDGVLTSGLARAVDALDSPAPVPADTSDPEPEPTTLRSIPPEWQEFNEELVEDLRDDEWVTCPSCCHDFTIDAEAGGRRIADAVTRLAMVYLTPSPSWPPMRPMSELADGHEEPVLIGYSGGRRDIEIMTHRSADAHAARIGWWPLPTVEEEGT